MTMTRLLLATGMVFCCSYVASAQVAGMLDQHVGTMDLRERPLESAVQTLSRETGLHILVMWETLGDDDLRQARANVSFSACRARDALRAMFPKAEIYEDAGWIHVVAKESAPTATRAYPVADLLSLMGPGSTEALVELIEHTVRSDDWADNGGRFDLRMQGTLLVACQTPAGHEAVSCMLDLLRAAFRARTNLAAPPPPRPTNANRKLPDLRFLETPLDPALESVPAAAHVPWLIQWNALDSAGITPGTPLTLDLSGRTVAQALRLLSEVTNIPFVLHDGIAEIETPDPETLAVESRVLDIRPMAGVVREYVSAFPGWRATVHDEVVADAMSNLIENIVDTDSWKDNGGTFGSCRQVSDMLVITNRPQAQEQIAAMMSDIQAASQPASQPTPPPKPDPLDAWIGDFDLSDTTLERALDRLGQRAEKQILVDWKSMESAGIDRNTSISVKLTGGSLRSALNVVLELASKSETSVGYRVDDAGIIHVGSADSVSHVAVTRIYNIRDLIGRYVDYHNVPPNVPDRQDAARTDAVDTITKLIEDTVDTDSWRDNGGSVGAMREFAGLLIITNTPQVHMKVKTLLDTLRTQVNQGVRPGQ
jgi:hypothetical protein